MAKNSKHEKKLNNW